MRIRNVLLFIFIGISFLIFSPFSSIYAQDINPGPNKDYFAAKKLKNDEIALHNVERFHLSADNFEKEAKAGHFKEALGHLKFVLKYFPNHPKALTLLGFVAKVVKNPSLPFPYYKKALHLYPQYALTHAQFGTYLTDIGQVNEGIAKLKEAIRIDPQLAFAHASLAKVYYRGGNVELARQAAAQARALGYKGNIP